MTSSRVLQGRQECERGLGALIAIGTVPFQTVERPPGVGVPHDRADVVVAAEPGSRHADGVSPAPVVVNGSGTCAGVGEGGHLNGLLIESRSLVAGTAAAGGGDGEMTAAGLAFDQPFQEVQPSRRRAGRPSAEPAAIIASGMVAFA